MTDKEQGVKEEQFAVSPPDEIPQVKDEKVTKAKTELPDDLANKGDETQPLGADDDSSKKDSESVGDKEDDFDEFSSFLNDVKALPTTEKAPPKSSGMLGLKESKEADRISRLLSKYEVDHVEVDWKDSDSQVDRIVAALKAEASFFDILLVPPYASKELIKKHFRKLSVMVHPDKCDHKEAQTAFMALKKGFEELQKPEYRAKYMDVIEEAKEQIIKEKKKKGEKTDEAAIRTETIERCNQILKEREERIEYAERTRIENELRLKRMEAEAEAEEYRKQVERNKWLERRDERVGNWREFREHVVAKRMRTESGEKRIASGVKAGGLDETYKKTWR
eukprot:Protomagalhaensia_sp_Gyna_25__4382@NODE_3_length_9524_cov_26_759410_g2_i0_p3_GENE_NODE_3_length_9524_cov_26_759410_g2_i0NODE_3_length_9524_cov_26_759410_g2_i0_p3_ORF_typecomplete_len336_score82_62DnaJ/PF00226_31/1_5e14DnaJ/PF00226_31/74_NODE_3_length_9524_cov_26_759410_g2_i080519058